MARLGVPYFYESSPLIEIAGDCMAKGDNRVSICSFCSRMKRGILYSTARREGYGVLAMAQHLDDCAESFLMSALHNGALRSMKARLALTLAPTPTLALAPALALTLARRTTPSTRRTCA